MTEAAATVAGGLICGFSSERYDREVTLPALGRGYPASGRDRVDFEIVCQALGSVVTSDEELEAARHAVREQIGFFATTPEYPIVLDVHGWAELHDELRALRRSSRPGELSEVIDDEMVETFAVIGTGEQVLSEPARRFPRRGGPGDRNSPATDREQ